MWKRIFLTHRKDLLMGDILIDDRTANGAGEFKGKLILFKNWLDALREVRFASQYDDAAIDQNDWVDEDED